MTFWIIYVYVVAGIISIPLVFFYESTGWKVTVGCIAVIPLLNLLSAILVIASLIFAYVESVGVGEVSAPFRFKRWATTKRFDKLEREARVCILGLILSDSPSDKRWYRAELDKKKKEIHRMDRMNEGIKD